MLSAGDPVRVGAVGLGYWGPNVARNLDATEGCELAWCCDIDAGARERWQRSFPAARFTADLDDVLADPETTAVAIASPVATHGPLARRALEAGKHCLVEKPLAETSSDADRLTRLAERNGLVLMVGHLLEYHPGIEALAGLIEAGELGDPYYVYSQRLNLGKLRADENALWSLGAHDVSMVLALAGDAPVEVSARGGSYVREGIEDVVFAHMRFESGLAAHLHLSWLDPHKERRLTVVGSKRMATFDDMALEGKVTLYDKGFDPDHSSYGEYITRTADVRRPAISNREPLRIEVEHFVECVREGRRPRTDGASGARVVRALEALQRSLESDGAPQQVEAEPAAPVPGG